MRSALATVAADIEELRWYVKFLGLERDLLAAANAEPACSDGDAAAAALKAHFANRASKRRFDYSCIIVALYGLLEQYIESLVKGYASAVAAIVPRFSDLPPEIREHHIDLSFGMITRAKQSRYRGSIAPDRIIMNLHSCLTDHDEFTINVEAFGHHTTNFRNDAIDKIFAQIGVHQVSQRIRLFSPLEAHLRGLFPDRPIEKLRPEDAFRTLNDLAERRNEVAHGSISEILSNDILLDYINYIDDYANSLFAVVNCSYLEHLTRHKAAAIGKPIQVIRDSIICIEVAGREISVGDLMIANAGGNIRPYVAGKIQELQVDRIPHGTIRADGPIKVGARVDFTCKANWDIFLLPGDKPAHEELPPEALETLDEDEQIEPE